MSSFENIHMATTECSSTAYGSSDPAALATLLS